MSEKDAQIVTTPKPGTPEYDAHMIAIAEKGTAEIRVADDPTNRSNTSVIKPGDKPAAEPAPADNKPQRPEWCPEKFWNAETGAVNQEAMAKSYAELERSRGKPTLNDPTKSTPAAPAAPEKSDAQKAAEAKLAAATTDADKATAQAELDAANAAAKAATEAPKVNLGDVVQKASDEFAEKGALSQETYDALAAQGLDRSYVDSYVAGLQAQAEVVTTKVFAEAGGEENYKAIQAWAVANLTPEEINAANAAFDSGDVKVVIGQVRSLKSRYDAALGTSGSRIETPNNSASGGNPFRSSDEVTKAMQDRRYKSDPAFRKEVEDRIQASLRANIDLGF